MAEDKRNRPGHFTIDIKLHRFRHVKMEDGQPVTYVGWQGSIHGADGERVGELIKDASAKIVLDRLVPQIEEYLKASGQAPEG